MATPRLLSENWYRHQALLVASAAAEGLAAANGGRSDPLWSTILFKRILNLPRGIPNNSPDIRLDSLSLPVSVRQRLHSLAEASGPNLWGPTARLFAPRTGRNARPRAAKLLAELLHYGVTPAATLWRIAAHELPDLQAIEDQVRIVECLDQLGRILRSRVTQRRKLQAVTAFGEDVPDLLSKWRALELALVQPLLDWLPMVVRHSGQHSTNPGIMMPAIIEVQDGPSGGEAQIAGMIGRIDALALSAERARIRAVDLWIDRHFEFPQSLRNEVIDAAAVIDLQLITGITAGLTTLRTNTRIEIEVDGSSLELPLALGIYRRLAALRRDADVRATGRLGTFVPETQQAKGGGDTRIAPVVAANAKVWAAEVQLADRMILPQGSAPVAKGAFIYTARSLGAAVDLAFGGNGDGHRFVRSADLAAVCKAAPYTDSEKISVRDQIVRNKGVVAELDAPPDLVAAALMSINKSISKGGAQSKGRYVFVRLSPTERADAAWATIWTAVDGDPTDLRRFIWADSDNERARIFASQLSRCRPTLLDPRYSPHVLVIVGTGEPVRPLGLPGGPHARFAVRRVLQPLDRFLGDKCSPADARLRRRLGSTRVILVRDDGMPTDELHPELELEPELMAAVEQLSPFRFGFSFAMACRQLARDGENEMPPEECTRLLTAIRRLKLSDGGSMLVSAASNARRVRAAPEAFEMMLRFRRLPTCASARFALHNKAAGAIAPLLRPSAPRAHVELSASLSAPWLDEAVAQLTLARSAASESNARPQISRELRTDRTRLLRISGSPVMERLPMLFGLHGDEPTYRDFVARLKLSRHPAIHVRAAAMAATLASDPDRPLDEQRQFFVEGLHHLEDADAASRLLPTIEEAQGASFLAATVRCLIAWETRHWAASEQLIPKPFPKLCAVAIHQLPAMREIYWPNWFEHAGDTVVDEHKARRVYRAGLWNELLPTGRGANDRLLIKWVGTFDPNELIPRGDLDPLKAHLDIRFLRVLRHQLFSQQAEPGLATACRWQRGILRVQRLIAAGNGMRSYAARNSSKMRDRRALQPRQTLRGQSLLP